MNIELVSAICILGIVGILLKSQQLNMPMSLISTLVTLLLIAYLSFAAFVLKEKAHDERELNHIFRASRFSYLVGIGVLILALIWQILTHKLDPWIVFAVCAMIFIKLITRVFLNIHR